MKFLFDEALNSATVRDHMDQCATRAADLQNKLRSLTSELKLLRVKEEFLGLSAEKTNSGVFNVRGDLNSDASSSQHASENISRGKPSEKVSFLAINNLSPSRSSKIIICDDLSNLTHCYRLLGTKINKRSSMSKHQKALTG